MRNYISSFLETETSGFGIRRICADSKGLYAVIEFFDNDRVIGRIIGNVKEEDGVLFLVINDVKYKFVSNFSIIKS